MTPLQIFVIQFFQVKTELQIFLSVISTCHNYFTDILNDITNCIQNVITSSKKDVVDIYNVTVFLDRLHTNSGT